MAKKFNGEIDICEFGSLENFALGRWQSLIYNLGWVCVRCKQGDKTPKPPTPLKWGWEQTLLVRNAFQVCEVWQGDYVVKR